MSMTSLLSTSHPLALQPNDFTGNFIDNAIVTSNAERWMLVHNPATNAVVTRVPRSTPSEIAAAVDRSVVAYQSWSRVNKGERQDRLLDFATLIRMHEAQIAATLTMETGKTTPDALAEIRRGLDMIKFAAASVERMGERGEMKSGMQVFTDKYPIGVCLTVTPFSLPFLVPLWTIPIAIAMGNVVIFKPSELCPHSALWIAVLMREAGFPPGVLNIVHGDGEVALNIAKHPSIKAVSFVGSEAAGTQVWDHCRFHRKKVQANLSGQNHLVILPDSPKEFAVHALVEASFGAAGQRCTSPKVAVLVGTAVEWLLDMVSRAQRLLVGDGSEERVDFGPVISRKAKDKILAQIEQAVHDGAEIALDGRGFVHATKPGGNWLAPTIISRVNPAMACYQEEIFGPVLICVEVGTLEDAIQLINENRYGNGCSIFTNSGASARQFQREVNVGLVNINNPHTAPAAGWSFSNNKDSFLGESNFYGPESINFFTYTKTLTSLWHHPDQQSMARTPR